VGWLLMSDFTDEEIKERLEKHRLWLVKDNEGEKFNAENVNLSYAQLSEANLSYAQLSHASFFRADLSGADLSAADLSGANLNEVDLSGADTSAANLSGADLTGTELYEANLNGADLTRAELYEANLSGADLTRVNLSGAKLIEAKALSTNFTGAILTNACIQDWHINADTKFEQVECEAIYLREGKWNSELREYEFLDRRPSDPNEFFKPGDFEILVRQSLETVDLIFREGINWQALDKSLERFKDKNNDVGLQAQSIENKGGDFVVKFAVPLDAEKGAIETFLRQEYDREIKAIEDKYRAELSAKDQEIISIERKHNTNLNDIIKLIATNQPSIHNQNINVGRDNNLTANNSVVSMGNISGSINNNVAENSDTSASNYDLRHANIGNLANTVKDQAQQQADQHNNDR
jgi:uncharacterized protein YjbI with pentapeptide repeats